MNSHKHARLTASGRALLASRILERGWTVRQAAEAAGVSLRTAYKWLARFKAEGLAGLGVRSSRPHHCPHAACPAEQERFKALRRRRWPLWRIALATGRSAATLSRCLRRFGLSRLAPLQPPAPVVRYERAAAGELLHLDTKRLGRIRGVGHRIHGQRQHRNRGIGWDAVHLAIDDYSRASFAQLKPDEGSLCCTAFLRQAVACYAAWGVRIDRVMTDNGCGYVSKAFKAACAELGVRHIRTRPYTPKTNGKVERFVQTSLREWAYAKAYRSSDEREAALAPFIHHYNWHRPHSALNHKPPMTRIPGMSNLLKLNS
jgi:transposase InsO family protein